MALIKKIGLLVLALLSADPAFAIPKLVVEPLPLQIHLVRHEMQLQNVEFLDQWTRACQSLGRFLVTDGSRSSPGFFRSFECTQSDLPVQASATVPWILQGEWSDKGLIWVLKFSAQDRPVAKSLLAPLSENDLAALEGPRIAQLVAFDILLQTPGILWCEVDSLRIDKEEMQHSWLMDHPDLIKAMGNLDFFTLTYDAQKKLWIPEPRQTGTLEFRGQRLALRVFHDRPVTYTDSHMWAVPQSDPQSLRKLTAQLLETEMDRYRQETPLINTSAILGSTLARDTQVGSRYGLSLTSEQLASQMRVLSSSVDWRISSHSGVGLYYDYWPEVKTNAADGPLEFASSRLAVGWSWFLPREWLPWIDRLDLTPHIGQWSMRLLFGYPLSGGGTNQVEYALPNNLTGYLRLGMEKSLGRHHLAAWGSQALGINVAPQSKGQMVKGRRFGVQDSIEVFSFRAYGRRLTQLVSAFFNYEKLTIDTTQNDSDSLAYLSSFSLVNYYGGMGFVLSW